MNKQSSFFKFINKNYDSITNKKLKFFVLLETAKSRNNFPKIIQWDLQIFSIP